MEKQPLLPTNSSGSTRHSASDHIRNISHDAENDNDSQYSSNRPASKKVSINLNEKNDGSAVNDTISSLKQREANQYMKWFALVALVVQNTALVLCMRYAKTREGPQFKNSTAVVMCEFVKLVTCLRFV